MSTTIQITEYTEYPTICGTLVPLYEEDTERLRNNRSVSLYESGALEFISLQKQTKLKTPLGEIPAEAVSFYEDGALRRILPVYGKLTAFWSEEDERALSPVLELALPFGSISARVISLYFYQTGKLKSVTLWPGEIIEVPTRYGEIPTRIGIAFYEDGSVKSLEPAFPIEITTSIGEFKAYDAAAVGINGDENSLVFDDIGYLTDLTTSINSVEVIDGEGKSIHEYLPSITYDELEPLRVRFARGMVTFGDSEGYSTSEYTFSVGQASLFMEGCGSDCSSCSGCDR